MARSYYLESRFNKLRSAKYSVTSNKTWRYNCIAWVFGDRKREWSFGRYWPCPTEFGETIGSMVAFFRSFGFDPCGFDASVEPGFEKIALYAKNAFEFAHVACQQGDGTWTSKLGQGRDITHETLQCLEGNHLDEYGSVVVIMKWPIQ
jgi:hypothetical protein